MPEESHFRYEQGSKAEQVAMYESQAKALSAMIEKQLEILDLKQGMRVLDAGCGSGAISRAIARKIAPGEAYGVDIEPFYIDEASRLAASESVKNVKFELGDLNANLRYEDGSFDLCYSRLVLMFSKDPVKTVGELKRITKNGGLVAVADNDDGTWLSYPEMPKLWKLWEKYGEFAKNHGEDGRVGRKLFSIFSEAGLDQVTIYPFPTCFTQQNPDALKFFPMAVRRLVESNKADMVAEGFVTPEEYNEALEEIPHFLSHKGALGLASLFFAVGKVP